MKPSKSTTTILFFALAVLIFSSFAIAKGPGGGNGPGGEWTELDVNEETHLKFIRAEEKLAHDVYLLLGEIYPDYAFVNITASETSHTQTMIDKLADYGLEDVNADDGPGEFAEANYGEYFSENYTLFTERGKAGLLEALKVGALIEELDMHDIILCPLAIVNNPDNEIELEECGLNYTDEKTLINSFENLVEGSENHLRAFVRQIESTFPEEFPYQSQYLEQEQVDDILGR